MPKTLLILLLLTKEARMEAKLTGTKAILGLILISLFSGYQYVTATTTINTEGRQAIQEWIASE